ncbi:DUF3644 domain-containing protein [Kineococcus sp. NPDC059986]|uniref:DUF3644 domain-containing protein n=1 Tax=Kineococcus sp. NPDC059986 TaxID=3155538 RepID=UPI00345050CC
MAPPPRHMQMVEASRDEAALAVRLYNDPAETRSFEGFVVHMHLAWLYLLHAQLERDGTDYRYWKPARDGKAPRLDKVDGEPKRWELSKCVQERWSDPKDPVRANLTFFIGLRNKIEHRYARQQDALTAAVGGLAQAFLLNYEEELTGQFGARLSLATRLRFPIFVGSFTTEGEKTLRRLRKQLPAQLRTFIAAFTAGLDPETSNDPRYEFRLRVVQELAPKDPDALAVQFTRLSDLTDEQRELVEQMGRQGAVIVREQRRSVVGQDLLKPGEVVKQVQELLPYRFNMTNFTEAWTRYEVRPVTGSETPERTDERYCFYDARHKDYGYTKAYARKLARECNSLEGFKKVTGRYPKDKETGVQLTPADVPLEITAR